MSSFVLILGSGILFVISLVSSIGPQNLNIMNHAIRRNHEYAVTTACFLADSTLILLGALGFKSVDSKPFLILINLFGIAFIGYYLWTKLQGLNKPHEVRFNQEILTQNAAILRALALTWLNPLVIIDTLVIIGGASTNYHGTNGVAFTLGALLGDFIWLFGLTFAARTFASKLNRPFVWMILDIVTIALLAYVLIHMLLFLFR